MKIPWALMRPDCKVETRAGGANDGTRWTGGARASCGSGGGVVLAHDFRFGQPAAASPSPVVGGSITAGEALAPRSVPPDGGAESLRHGRAGSVRVGDGFDTSAPAARRRRPRRTGACVPRRRGRRARRRADRPRLEHAVPARGRDDASAGTRAARWSATESSPRSRATRAPSGRSGTVCAGNRFLLLVPCHRVVAADGIGGYGSAGVAVKRRLLALEGVEL